MMAALQEEPYVYKDSTDYGAFHDDILTRKMRDVAADIPTRRMQKIVLNLPARKMPEATPDISMLQTGEMVSIPGQNSWHNPQIAPVAFPVAAAGSFEQSVVSGQGQAEQPVTKELQNSKKKWIKFIIRLAVTLLLFTFLLKSISWPTLFVALTHVHKGLILVGLVICLSGIVLSAYQWHTLLHGESIPFDLADLISLYMVGIAFNHFLPTGMGGDAVKAFHVGRDSGNIPGSASAVVMCRVTGFFGMLMIALPVLIIWHQHFKGNLILWFLFLSVFVGGMIAGAIFSVTLLPKFFKGKWIQHRVFASAVKIGTALSLTAKRPRSMTVAIVYGVIFWVISILNAYLYGVALNMQAPLYFFFVAIPMISLIAFLPISINGFGLREGAFVFIFSTINVAPTLSLLLALFLDLQTLFFGILGGGIYFLMSAEKKETQQKDALPDNLTKHAQ
jgi:uncharacterized protein (TIRG00374 family)